MAVMLPVLILLAGSRDAPNVVQPGADLYPPAAAAARVQGDVPVRLEIAADGGIRCTSSASERLALLKRASCELIVRRDIFPPRIGRDGVAVPTTLDLTVRWRLGADMTQFGGAVPIGRSYWIRHPDYPYQGPSNLSGGRVRVSFEVSATGRVENCVVDKSATDITLEGLVCPLLTRRAALLPALDHAGVPRRTRGWFAVLWRNTPLSEDFSEEDPYPPGVHEPL